MDMLLFLPKPGRLLYGEDILAGAVPAHGLCSGPMPWLGLSDLLITRTKLFVGIALHVGGANAANAPLAEEFAAACDPKIARYVPSAIAKGIPRYEENGWNNSVLELCWSDIQADEETLVQLAGNWYYKTGDDPERAHPRAWGLDAIEDIMKPDLVFPEDHY